jgi:glycosyltransferase involved in cell wall biosynthesis
MKLLFITRTYPPLVGGMEKYASDFYKNYQKIGDVDLLANPGGKKTFVFFLIRAMFTLIFNARKYDVIHLYDAVLFPLVPIIKIFSSAKISFTVNGLDIAYSRFGYQKIMPCFLRQADKVIGISQYTMMQCKLRGIPSEKLTSIPIGITFDEFEICPKSKKSETLSRFCIPAGKKILFTVGRLVKRKGHAWFVENVVNRLPDDYVYVIAGDGPELETIKNLVHKLDLNAKVYVLGQITEDDKNCLYQISHLFIMPNIHVPGDQEGFGIVLLEAGLRGIPIIASNIEGIKDAVIDGKTGRLVEEKDAQGFLNAIIGSGLEPSSISSAVIRHFHWNNISRRYYKEFTDMTSSKD